MASSLVQAGVMLAAHGIELYANYIKQSRHMTEEQALEALSKIQLELSIEDAAWEDIIKRLDNGE